MHVGYEWLLVIVRFVRSDSEGLFLVGRALLLVRNDGKNTISRIERRQATFQSGKRPNELKSIILEIIERCANMHIPHDAGVRAQERATGCEAADRGNLHDTHCVRDPSRGLAIGDRYPCAPGTDFLGRVCIRVESVPKILGK